MARIIERDGTIFRSSSNLVEFNEANHGLIKPPSNSVISQSRSAYTRRYTSIFHDAKRLERDVWSVEWREVKIFQKKFREEGELARHASQPTNLWTDNGICYYLRVITGKATIRRRTTDRGRPA